MILRKTYVYKYCWNDNLYIISLLNHLSVFCIWVVDKWRPQFFWRFSAISEVNYRKTKNRSSLKLYDRCWIHNVSLPAKSLYFLIKCSHIICTYHSALSSIMLLRKNKKPAYISCTDNEWRMAFPQITYKSRCQPLSNSFYVHIHR